MKTREELKKYLFGEGIEIGALQNPLDISGLPIKKIRYVDRLSVADLRKHYPELNELPLMDPDILDDGQKLAHIEENSLDFIVANHLIEHVDSPLSALENWSKKLKENGILFMAVPDKRFTFDKDRDLTSLSHLIDDFQSTDAERDARDFEHFFEWSRIIGKKVGAEAKNEAKKLHEEKYSIHYHVWTFDSFVKVLHHVIDELKIPFEILDYSASIPGSNEFIFILRKTSPVDVSPKEITDIVIPVYNGYHFFRDCFQSIITNTKKGAYQIIVVDDCSTEKEIIDYFEELEKIYSDTLVMLRNEKNVGFVKSVNHGMQYNHEHDIILLNSDTVVTKNWLTKLKECALSDERVATVTPLTNNGTICSIPEWLQNNKLPDGLDIQTYANLIEKASRKKYIEVPTAVGFCMFIKRNILNKIGPFDEENYGKGYGEENDFSMKAKKNGYKNILDDSTFIYHKGNMSFSPADYRALTHNNSKVLLSKYPNYEKEVSDFIDKKPLAEIIDHINIATENFQGNNILYFIHADPYTIIGGSEKHTLDMAAIFKDYFNFIYLLYFDDSKLFLERISRHKGKETVLVLPIGHPSDREKEFEFSEINKVFEDILEFYNIKIVHFQHLLNLPLTLIETAKIKAKKILITVHDYYLYCPHPHLLYDTFSQKKCLDRKCSDCQDRDISPNMIADRRNKIEKLLSKVDKIIFPTNYIRDNFIKFYPKLKGLFISIEHPYLVQNKNRLPGFFTKSNDIPKEKMNLAFFGYFSKHKGSELFRDFALKYSGRFNFFILGKIEDGASFDAIKNIVRQFEYFSFQDMEKLISENQIDILLLLSIVPESFSYTLTESLLLQLPLVATNLGAFPERLKNINYCELFDLDTKEKQKTLSSLISSIDKLAEKIKKQPVIATPYRLDKHNNIVIEKYLKLYKN